MQTDPFVHLRVRTSYSMLRSSLRVKKIAQLCQQFQMPAVAITDSSLFGILEFTETMKKAGVQPIIGCCFQVEFPKTRIDKRPKAKSSKRDSIEFEIADWVLLAANETGYNNIMELSSLSWDNTISKGGQVLSLDDLVNCSEGTIALTGGLKSPIVNCIQEGDQKSASLIINNLKDIYRDRLCIEIPALSGFSMHNQQLVSLANECSVPAVATADCHFADESDYEATLALQCIGAGRVMGQELADEEVALSADSYFASGSEMKRRCAAFPEAYQNTIELAKRCSYWPEERTVMLPSANSARIVTTPKETTEADIITSTSIRKAEADELRNNALNGLNKRLEIIDLASGFTDKDYYNRLDEELEIINKMEFPGYFLIVADFVNWAKSNDIPVGPGRGSGAASLVAYSIGITDVDPLRYDLLFERFLNPERVSMPDFDIDICQDRRGEVINYVQQKYGEERVAQIITFGSLQPRAVLRDVGRVMQIPYGKVDRLARLIPFVPANPYTLQRSLDEVPELARERKEDDETAKLIDFGLRLEGLYRHASTHAAGIVIADRDLRTLVPLYRDERSNMPATQFSMNWVEHAGLIKFDFLGLKTLTVIKEVVNNLKTRGIDIDIDNVPLDDKKTFELMSAGQTVGVFQFESPPMRSWLIKLKPTRLEDMIAMNSLYRPGPMDNIPSFISRKHGEEEIDWLHPSLKKTLEDTYGVIIYQEQVIRIAEILSGYSKGEADILRRAMGKKKPEEMKLQREKFVSGAATNNIDSDQAEAIFDLVLKFAGYGFNKAHSTCYAFVAYQTAWLKANYPVEFFASLMNSEINNSEKFAALAEDARRMGIKLLPPCVNASEIEFSVENSCIRYGLSAIRNVGYGVAESIVEQRKEHGVSKGLSEWLQHANPDQIKKRCLEFLITAGAMDSLDSRRWVLLNNVEKLSREISIYNRDKSSGQTALFGLANYDGNSENIILDDCEKWTNSYQMAREFQALGWYLTGHPLQNWMQSYQALGLINAQEFNNLAEIHGSASGWVAGVISKVSNRATKSGNTLKIIELSDPTKNFEVAMYSEAIEGKEDLLKSGNEVVLAMVVSEESDGRWRCNDISSIKSWASSRLRSLIIYIENQSELNRLTKNMTKGRNSEIELIVSTSKGAKVSIQLPEKWNLNENLWNELKIQSKSYTNNNLA